MEPCTSEELDVDAASSHISIHRHTSALTPKNSPLHSPPPLQEGVGHNIRRAIQRELAVFYPSNKHDQVAVFTAEGNVWVRVMIQDTSTGTMGGLNGQIDKNGNLIDNTSDDTYLSMSSTHRTALNNVCLIMIVPKTNLISICTNVSQLPTTQHYMVSAVVTALCKRETKYHHLQVVPDLSGHNPNELIKAALAQMNGKAVGRLSSFDSVRGQGGAGETWGGGRRSRQGWTR